MHFAEGLEEGFERDGKLSLHTTEVVKIEVGEDDNVGPSCRGE